MISLNAKVFIIKIVASLVLEIAKIDKNSMCIEIVMIRKPIIDLWQVT